MDKTVPPPPAMPQFKRLSAESLKRLREERQQLKAEKMARKAARSKENSDSVAEKSGGGKKRGAKKSIFDMLGKEAFPRKRPTHPPPTRGGPEPLDPLEKMLGPQPTLPGDEEDEDRNEEDEEDEEGNAAKPKANWALVAGKKLPPALDDYFEPKLFSGVPLEEIDEYYKGRETCVAIGKDKTIFRFSASRAFFLLAPTNFLRRLAIYLLVHPLFSVLVLLAIIVNCGFMTLPDTPSAAETTFTIIYTVEATIKALARGFILHEFSYLRDPWNWLDIIVLCLAYLMMMFENLLGNVSGIRTLRVLRALKSVTALPGLRVIISALVEAVKRLRDAIILTVFVLAIFALVGLQLYKGTMKHKCVIAPITVALQTNESVANISSAKWDLAQWTQAERDAWNNDVAHWYPPDPAGFLMCGKDAGECPAGYNCTDNIGPNPNFGYTNFDNFGFAYLCAFRLMTQDYWENLYLLTLRANGLENILFFLIVILLGSDYLINVILAIVAMSYDDCCKQEKQLAELLLRQKQENEERREKEADALIALVTKDQMPEEGMYVDNIVPSSADPACPATPKNPRKKAWSASMSGPTPQRHRCTCSPPCPPDGVCIQAIINRLATRSDSCLHLDRSTEKVLLFDKERWEKRGVSVPGTPKLPWKVREHLPHVLRPLKPLERKSVRYLGVEMPFADESRVGSPVSPARGRSGGFEQQLCNSLSPTHAHPHIFADLRSRQSPECDYFPASAFTPPRSPARRRSLSPLVRYDGPSCGGAGGGGGGEYKEKAALTTRPVTLKTSWSPRAARKPKGLVPTVVVESCESPMSTAMSTANAPPTLTLESMSIPPTPPQRPPPDDSELLQVTVMNDTEAQSPGAADEADNASSNNRLRVEAIEIIKRARSTSQGAISREDLERLRMLIEDAKASEAEAEVTVETLSAAQRRADSVAALSRKKKEKWSRRLLLWMKRTLWDSWTCPRWFQLFQRCVAFFICDPFTDLFITICIVLNTACLAADHHGPTATETFRAILKNANTFFTITFSVEFFLKLIALSPMVYLKDHWNQFDGFIVGISLFEMAFGSEKGGLSVLRSFRLLRVFKLAKSWPTLNKLISIIFRTLGALGNLTFVLTIIIFIFAVVGTQVFGENYKKKCYIFNEACPRNESEALARNISITHTYVPRWNMTDFWHTFMVVFRVLCGEWIETMWDCIRVNEMWSCIPFFMATMMIGNLVILKLFLALLLSSFSGQGLDSKDDEEPNKIAEAIDRIQRFIKWIRSNLKQCLCCVCRSLIRTLCPCCVRAKARIAEKYNMPRSPSTGSHSHHSSPRRPDSTGSSVRKLQQSISVPSKPPSNVLNGDSAALEFTTSSPVLVLNGEIDLNRKKTEEDNKQRCGEETATAQVTLDQEVDETEVNVVYSEEPEECCPSLVMRVCWPCCDWFDSTSCGQTWTRVRKFSLMIIENNKFETFIMFMIGLSSMSLALDDVNLPKKPLLKEILEYADKTFNVIFTTEMLLKWFAYGFKKYFTDAWCWVDFVCVFTALLSTGMEIFGGGGGNMGAFKAMRTLRALRPLRAISRWQGMRVVVNALIQSIPSIFNVLLVCLVFWLIFAIMSVQFFAGKFYKCMNKTGGEPGERISEHIVPGKNKCLELEANGSNVKWENSVINFDNVGNAYLSLLQVATFKGWMEIMADAVDITEMDQQPVREVSLINYSFFVMFIIFGSFFTLNLFIGVIIDNFNKQKKKMGNTLEMFMTEDQKKYYHAMKKLSSKRPERPVPKPKFFLARWCYSIVRHPNFDIFIMVVILLNTIVMCCEHDDESEEFEKIIELLNNVFVIIFTLEFLLKVIALRLYYFKEPWNVFDFIVVVISFVIMVTGMVLGAKQAREMLQIPPSLVRIVRVFRVGRVLRLVKSAKGLRTLLFSLMVSLPALFNIAILLFLVFFIYSIFGVNFFMHTRRQYGIDDMFNFETVPAGMALLFQISTSAGWNGVLAALIVESEPLCTPHPKEPGKPSDCGNAIVAVPFLVSYLIITFLVIVNMYIAVILENFSQATEDVNTGLTQDDYDIFYEQWQMFDTKASGYILLVETYDLLDRLEEPLKIPKPNRIKLAIFDIPIYEGDRINCVDLLDALTKDVLKTQGNSELPLENEELTKMKEKAVRISSTLQRQREITAARVIVRTLRRWIAWKAEHREQFDEYMRLRRASRPPPPHPLLQPPLSTESAAGDAAGEARSPATEAAAIEQQAACPADPLIREDGGPPIFTGVAADGGH